MMRDRLLQLQLLVLLLLLFLLVEHDNFDFFLHLLLPHDVDLLRYGGGTVTQIATHSSSRDWAKLLSPLLFIEREHSLGQWWYLAGCNLNLDILNLPDYGLKFAALNPLQRPYDAQNIHLLLILLDRLLWGVVMLLVAEQYVVEQRTFARQEANSYLQRLSVPILRL